MFRDAYAAHVEVVPDATGSARSGAWVVLLPRGNADAGSAASCSRELQLLVALQREQLPFRTPRSLGTLPTPHGTAFAREYLPGIPVDLRAGRQPGIQPWEVVATIAAAVHAIDARKVALLFPKAPATRRDHARLELRALESLQLAEARDAAAWAAEHAPPDEPAVLLYGDLLGQNILVDPTDSRPFAAIDWSEAMMSDPAYDFAIVTRGARRPFQIEGGLDRLLEAYPARPGAHPCVTREQVHLYELCLAAHWCKVALAASPSDRIEPVAEATARLRRVLAMATSAR
ncbi:MAG TPA: aminoglycoside phosphotransferase family protein [Polyangiales bacterium]|nr:aminoglycoside phosphotransferase family protein [Polyangiales bacterium]